MLARPASGDSAISGRVRRQWERRGYSVVTARTGRDFADPLPQTTGTPMKAGEEQERDKARVSFVFAPPSPRPDGRPFRMKNLVRKRGDVDACIARHGARVVHRADERASYVHGDRFDHDAPEDLVPPSASGCMHRSTRAVQAARSSMTAELAVRGRNRTDSVNELRSATRRTARSGWTRPCPRPRCGSGTGRHGNRPDRRYLRRSRRPVRRTGSGCSSGLLRGGWWRVGRRAGGRCPGGRRRMAAPARGTPAGRTFLRAPRWCARSGTGSFPGGIRRHRGLIRQDLDLVEREPGVGETQGHLVPTVVGAVVLPGGELDDGVLRRVERQPAEVLRAVIRAA